MKQKPPVLPILFSLARMLVHVGGLVYCAVLLSLWTGLHDRVMLFGWVLLLEIALFAVTQLTVLLHEMGHLVCALMCGERFFYFSIGPLHIVRRANGGLGWGLRHTPGVAGSCMTYAEGNDTPYALKLLGGVLANLVTGLIFAGLAYLTRPYVVFPHLNAVPVGHILLLLLAMESLLHVLPNLIPMATLTAGNDGYLLRQLRTSEEERAAYRQMQRVVGALQREIPLGDMPAEWFAPCPAERLNNVYAQSMAVDGVSRMLVRGEYEQALARIGEMLGSGVTFSPVIQLKLVMDGALCELLTGQAGEYNARFESRELRKLIRMMSRRLDVTTTRYAVAKLQHDDRLAADDAADAFARFARRHPFPADVRSERALHEAIDAAYANQHQEKTEGSDEEE